MARRWRTILRSRFLPRRVPLSACVDVTGAYFYTEAGPEAAPDAAPTLHLYTKRCLNLESPGLENVTVSTNTLIDLFPELQGLPEDHPARLLPADTHLTPWFGGDPHERIAKTRENLSQEFPSVGVPQNPLFGALSPEQNRYEESRIRTLYTSITEKGFITSRRRDETIHGVFVQHNGDTRFFVMAGKHRLAVLSALHMNAGEASQTSPNYPSTLSIRLRDPGVVRSREVERWPLVQNGLWPRTAAISYIERLFVGRSYVELQR